MNCVQSIHKISVVHVTPGVTLLWPSLVSLDYWYLGWVVKAALALAVCPPPCVDQSFHLIHDQGQFGTHALAGSIMNLVQLSPFLSSLTMSCAFKNTETASFPLNHTLLCTGGLWIISNWIRGEGLIKVLLKLIFSLPFALPQSSLYKMLSLSIFCLLFFFFLQVLIQVRESNKNNLFLLTCLVNFK